MNPLPIAGLTIAGKTLLSKYNRSSLSGKNKIRFRLNLKKRYVRSKARTAVNPLQTLLKGFEGISSNLSANLSTALSRITKRTAREDYDAVVKSLLPPHAKLLAPNYPLNSREIQIADIDGDTYNEVITSYRFNNEIRTAVLKKQGEKWYKDAESDGQEYDAVDYRGIADMTGKGKRLLLMGMASKGKSSVLNGYSLENGKLNKVFSKNYQRFEILYPKRNRSALAKAQLAVWNKNEAGSYDVELYGWDGKQLEPLGNTASYYYTNMAPYFAGKIKQEPYTPSNWYHLASALEKSGAYRDALTAAGIGIRLDKNSEYREKFLAIRNRITGS